MEARQGTRGKLGGEHLCLTGAGGSVKIRGLDFQMKESVILRS